MENLKLTIKRVFSDWRARAIIIAASVCILATIIVYAIPIDINPANHFGAVFAGWVGGLALFIVAGTVVAIVSLVKPEDEFFDYRARVLFRHQTGKHIDYIVEKLKSSFEFYSEHTTIKLVVKEYNEETKKFRIEQNFTAIVRPYIDDVPTFFKSSVNLKGVTAPPDGKARNRLTFVRIDDKPHGQLVDFDDTILQELSATVEAGKSCKVRYQIEFWINEGSEPVEHMPIRYTQKIAVSVDNFCSPKLNLSLSLAATEGSKEQTVPLEHGSRYLKTDIAEVRPMSLAYAIKFAPT